MVVVLVALPSDGEPEADALFDVRGRMLGADFVRSEALRFSLLKDGDEAAGTSLSDSLPGNSNFGIRDVG